MRGKTARLIARAAGVITAKAHEDAGEAWGRQGRIRVVTARQLRREWYATPRRQRRKLRARIRAGTVHIPNRIKGQHNEDCDHDQPLAFPKGERGAFTGACRECGATKVCSGCRAADRECYCEGV